MIEITVPERSRYGRLAELVRMNADHLQASGKLLDESQLVSDSIDSKPAKFHCLTACVDGEMEGYALYYYTYSTWEGRMLYLQDLYGTPACRTETLTALIQSLANIAKDKLCSRIQWVMQNNQKDEIALRKTMGAVDITTSEQWHQYRLPASGFDEFIQKCKANVKKAC